MDKEPQSDKKEASVFSNATASARPPNCAEISFKQFLDFLRTAYQVRNFKNAKHKADDKLFIGSRHFRTLLIDQ